MVPPLAPTALMSAVLAPECLEETAFLVVSKSGGTAETLAQAIAALTALGDNLDNDGLAERFVMISEPGDGALRRLADGIGARVLPHDPDVGGRFSVLSLVGLLPALLLGLDAAAVRRGAREVLEAALDADDIATAGPAIGAAVNVGLLRHRGINQAVLLAYAEALRPFALWYRQLWAESLGKNGHGTTPIDALGPVDQHSQLQMYLEGPSDKLFTVLTLDPADQGPAIDRAMAEQLGLDYMAGRRIGDLVAAMQRATADALACRGRPVRRLGATALDERTLGALFMHFLLETVFAADLFGVDPFGQPAVESGKQRARDYLREAAP